MENLVVGPANLFAFILNQTDEVQDLVWVQTPDFRPNDCEYRLKVEPHNSISFDGIISSKITDRLPNILNSTRIIWQVCYPLVPENLRLQFDLKI